VCGGDLQLSPLQILAQIVETCSGKNFIAFWDSGSQVTMLTHRKAVAAGLMCEPANPLLVKGFKSKGLLLDMGYHIPLKTKDREMRTMLAYAIDEIITDVNCSLDRDAAVKPMLMIFGDQGGQLCLSLLLLADGGRFLLLPPHHRQNTSGPEVQDLHPESGTGGLGPAPW
jgi:hypothetical protein